MAGTPEMLAHLAERARSHARWDKARRLVARDTRDLGQTSCCGWLLSFPRSCAALLNCNDLFLPSIYLFPIGFIL